MSNQDQIAYLVAELDTAKQKLAKLRADPASPDWLIKRVEDEVAKLEGEIATLRQADTGGSVHNQTISGNANVGVAVSGNVHGAIKQQSGGVRYEGGSYHSGDNVAGDKIMGDKVAGNKVMGDTNTFGDVSNSFINIKSLLDGVEQSINASPRLDAAGKTELQSLFKELANELQKASSEKSVEVAEVAKSAKETAEELGKEQAEKSKLSVSVEGLKQAASNLGTALPTIIPIANRIVEAITKYS
jgi:predicted  nucleic acid-binding Zn-ribbon protein